MIQYQILITSIIRIALQTVRRISNEILGTEGLRKQEPAEEAEDPHCVIHNFKC